MGKDEAVRLAVDIVKIMLEKGMIMDRDRPLVTAKGPMATDEIVKALETLVDGIMAASTAKT
jgi:hypothetical protein